VRLTRVADIRQMGCEQPAGALPPAPPATGPRDRLTAAVLLAPTEADTGLVHNAYFLPIGQAAPARHVLQGTVTLKGPTMYRTRYGCAGSAEVFSGFSGAFFTQGQYLGPAVRDMMPHTSVILSPGQVWSEPGDGGLSRASFPFVLTNLYNNETRNGLAPFVYDDTQVSALRFQVVQETTAWAKFDGWGQASMT